jgi:hypothetical protein
VNATATKPAMKQIEDAALAVHRHVHQATGHAQAGDYRRAHAEAEQAQGAARRLKELLGATAPSHPTGAQPEKPGSRTPTPVA